MASIYEGKNELLGDYNLVETGQGILPLLIGQRRLQIRAYIGKTWMKDKCGKIVERKHLETLLEHVPKIEGFKLMPSQIYFRIAFNQMRKTGYNEIFYNFMAEKKDTCANNLFILDPFNRGAEHISPELRERLAKRHNAENYKDSLKNPAIFISDVTENNGEFNAKWFDFCYLFLTQYERTSTNTLLNRADIGQRAKIILRLITGIPEAESIDRLNLGWSGQGDLMITGAGPVYRILMKTNEYSRCNIWVYGDEPINLRGRLIKITEQKDFARGTYGQLVKHQ
jgi:hypothetical protein